MSSIAALRVEVGEGRGQGCAAPLVTDGAGARRGASGDTHLFCERRREPRPLDRSARGRALPPVTQARSPATGRAGLPRAGPHLQESGNPGVWGLPGEAVARGDGTRVTHGAGLFRGKRCLDFDPRQLPPSPCPAGLAPLQTRAPRTCPFSAGRRPCSPKLQADCFRRRLLGPQVFFVQRQSRTGGRGQAKEWRPRFCRWP